MKLHLEVLLVYEILVLQITVSLLDLYIATVLHHKSLYISSTVMYLYTVGMEVGDQEVISDEDTTPGLMTPDRQVSSQCMASFIVIICLLLGEAITRIVGRR